MLLVRTLPAIYQTRMPFQRSQAGKFYTAVGINEGLKGQSPPERLARPPAGHCLALC